jgi:hypothetical protein
VINSKNHSPITFLFFPSPFSHSLNVIYPLHHLTTIIYPIINHPHSLPILHYSPNLNPIPNPPLSNLNLSLSQNELHPHLPKISYSPTPTLNENLLKNYFPDLLH